MPKTSTVRNGVELESPVTPGEITGGRSDPVSSPETMKEAKMVIFRSKDRELTLVQQAGYTEKSHGVATYVQTKSVQFVDFIFMVVEKPETKEVIKWLRGHPQHGITFREVPVDDVRTVKPAQADLEKMTMRELKETCEKRQVEIAEDAGREQIILAILR